MDRRIIRGLAAASAVAVTGLASAATGIVNPAQQAFAVSLTIEKECLIGSVDDISFGTSGFLLSDLTSSGDITIGCTKGTVATVKLSAGDNHNGTTRRMQRGTSGDYVNYELYTDTYSTVWTTSTTTQTVTGTGGVTSNAADYDQSLTIYAKVPSQSTAAPGDYTDTVTAIVSF